ncbi:P3H1 [Mytilus coruscus]|uniref:procollagen-proline 3-dioxygenase n=1 Tax=Mytilus coruscus TaxID=42192 RepID=A0A6J8AGW2_MYTCO|nr:P3H1 [Mytilus coruscus]
MTLHMLMVILIICLKNTNSLSEFPKLTYDHLYTEGLKAFEAGKWFQCVGFFKKAIESRKSYKKTVFNCKLKCREGSGIVDNPNLNTTNDIYDLLKWRSFSKLVKESQCTKRCQENKLGYDQIENSEDIDTDFESYKPYRHLQICYEELKRYTDATCAAYTYYLRNPTDEETIASIYTYRDDFYVKEEDVKNLETKQYQECRIKGEEAFDHGDWTKVIEWIEIAIEEYYKEEERCRVECEDHFNQQSALNLIQAIAGHYISVLECQLKCQRKLSIIHTDYLPDFVGQHYHLLQIAYHKSGNDEQAAECAATYLVFNPNDEETLNNKTYFMKKLGYNQEQFKARQEAVEYEKRRTEMLQLLYFLRDELNKMKEQGGDKDNFDESDKKHKTKIQIRLKTNERYHMEVNEKTGFSETVIENGRIIADGFLNKDQCQQLTNFTNMAGPNSDGISIIKIADSFEHVKKNTKLENSLRLISWASDQGRNVIAKMYNKTNLFVENSFIVCVDPETEDQYSEDCIPQEYGSCLTAEEIDNYELINDKFVVAIFLTDATEPGHFNFLDRRHEKEIPVVSKCGRVVGFRLSDRHRSERSVSQRCSMVFIYSSNRQEDTTVKTYLMDLDKRRNEVRKANREDMREFYENGVRIVMGEKELRSKLRFAADGLLTEEQCQTLIEINQEGAIGGDGFDYKKSPMTKSEIFDGLTLSRAAELTYAGILSKQGLRLFLDASDYGKVLVEKYFNLTQPLYFDYTQLNCRTAIEGAQTGREDLSHPVHGDNCDIQKDGSCIRNPSGYVHRDFSSLLYLNGDFEGGEFFFAHKNWSTQISIKPKCGMIVGFDSAEFHGVKAVTKGRRCTLAMWYTLDKRFDEQTRIQVRQILDKIPNEVDAQEHSQFMTIENKSKNEKEKEKTQEKTKNKTKQNNIKDEEKNNLKEASLQKKLNDKRSKEFKQRVNNKKDKEFLNQKELTTTEDNKLRKDDELEKNNSVHETKENKTPEEDDGVTIKVIEDDDIREPEDAYDKGQNLDAKQNSHNEL